MAQFDVHRNPITAARRAYPLVVELQSTLAAASRSRIVAPLAPRTALPQVSGRLTPIVRLDGLEYVVLVPALATVASRDLLEPVGSLTGERTALLAAIDYLFFGV
ncbi:MAG: CcdB family protein [Gammaproteobacteria bacterium]|nr:CcdB family protein [Gammaproteobacteria bacterium]